MFILWLPAFNTGIEEIDLQHRQLVAIINELHDTRHAGSSKEEIDAIVSKFISYSKYHFDFEEEILEKQNYPELEGHKAAHQSSRDLIETILGMDFAEDSHRVEDMLLMSLKRWLVNHVSNEARDVFLTRG